MIRDKDTSKAETRVRAHFYSHSFTPQTGHVLMRISRMNKGFQELKLVQLSLVNSQTALSVSGSHTTHFARRTVISIPFPMWKVICAVDVSTPLIKKACQRGVEMVR